MIQNKGLAYGLHYPYAAAGYHYLGKREAEADPALVTYSNGAVVPFDPAHHSVYSAYPYAYNFGLYGKKVCVCMCIFDNLVYHYYQLLPLRIVRLFT